MKQYEFQNRSQNNSHSCVPLKSPVKTILFIIEDTSFKINTKGRRGNEQKLNLNAAAFVWNSFKLYIVF